MRVAFIGGGPVVSELHLPAVRRLGWVGAQVFDRSPMEVAALRKRFPEGSAVVADFREAISSLANVDLAVVALPNHLHEAACHALLSKKIPVLCEKPLALSAEVCRRLSKAFAEAGVPLAVGMSRRFIPAISVARDVFKKGLLGRLESVSYSHGSPYAWGSKTGEPFRPENGGVLADMGIHYFDLARWWFGDLRLVRYWDDWEGGVEAEAAVDLETTGGVPVRIELSRRRLLRNEIRICGSDADLVLDVDHFGECRVEWKRDDLRAEVRRAEGGAADFVAAFEAQFRAVERRLAQETADLVDPLDHARCIELIEACYGKRRRHQDFPTRDASVRQRWLGGGSVAVTGATGFIGTRLVERLFESGVQDVRAVIRSFSSVAGIARFPVRLIQADLIDAEALREVFRGASTVVHLAFGASGTSRERKRATIDGTRAVVEAAIAEGVGAVVVLSTLWVFGFPRGDKEHDETSRYQPYGGEYARSKAAMERWCRRRARTSPDTRIVILNPGVVYGPWNRGYIQLPHSLAKKGHFYWVEQGRGHCHFCHVDNLIDAISSAAAEPRAHGERINMFDGRSTWRRFLAPFVTQGQREWPSYSVGQAHALVESPSFCGLAARLLSDPAVRDYLKRLPLLSWAYALIEWWRPGGARQMADTIQSRTPLKDRSESTPPSWLPELFHPNETRFSNALAIKLLKWQPRISLDEGQAQCVEWLENLERRTLEHFTGQDGTTAKRP